MDRLTYTYDNQTYNGVELHVISSSADNICLGDCGGTKTLATAGFYGINGAFFSSNGTLSIAIQAGQNACSGGTYNGQENVMGHACLYYTASGAFGWYSSIQFSSSLPSGISWAQGGPSLRLGFADGEKDIRGGVVSPYTWEYCLEDEMDTGWQSNGARRTALVGDLVNKQYYMFITRNYVNALSFRTALSDYLGISNNGSGESSQWKGIMLDGGTSSALRCAEANLTPGRNLKQVVTVKY